MLKCSRILDQAAKMWSERLLVGQRALAAQSPPGVKKLKLGEDSEEIKNVSTDGSKESDAYNNGIIRKAAAWRKKYNPKGHTELLPPHLLGFTSSTETVLRAMVTGATR